MQKYRAAALMVAMACMAAARAQTVVPAAGSGKLIASKSVQAATAAATARAAAANPGAAATTNAAAAVNPNPNPNAAAARAGLAGYPNIVVYADPPAANAPPANADNIDNSGIVSHKPTSKKTAKPSSLRLSTTKPLPLSTGD